MTRFLLVRLGALGDIVHALPAAAALRERFPHAQIDWLVERKHRALLDLVPVIDTRIAVDPRAWSGPLAPLAVVRALRRMRYDVALDLQGLIKSAVFARASGARRVIGYASAHLREPAARRFYTELVDPGDTTHVIDKGLAILRALGIDAGHIAESDAETAAATARGIGGSVPAVSGIAATGATVHRSDARRAEPRPMLRTGPRFPIAAIESHVPACTRQLLGLWPDEPFVLINPGAAWPNKRWPADRFGGLARELRARHGLRSAVLWGPGEETLAAQVARVSGGAAEMAPATGLADLIALTRAARVLVSGDTGPIHLAAAVGTPVVGVYGPTDPRRNGPWSPDDESVSRFGRCACHHQRQCRVAAWCLADVPLHEVLDAVERRLTRVS
jgi:lipopolysaccharide heptosyltransferase I